jgi:hypothetical protein
MFKVNVNLTCLSLYGEQKMTFGQSAKSSYRLFCQKMAKNGKKSQKIAWYLITPFLSSISKSKTFATLKLFDHDYIK